MSEISRQMNHADVRVGCGKIIQQMQSESKVVGFVAAKE